MSTDRQANALAAALNQRMRELELDQRILSERSGVAPSTVRDLQRGSDRAHRPSTLAKVSRALDWPADALVKIVSVVPEQAASPSAPDPAYEPPQLTVAGALDRIQELELELADLRRIVTAHVVAENRD